MDIALFSPIPPQQSGIADYIFHLLKGFSNYSALNITVFSNIDVNSVLDYKVIFIDDIAEHQLEQYDLIIYQLGNNIHYHGYMLELLKKHGGIVHLHDVVLHHLFAMMTCDNDKANEYLEAIERHYGSQNRELIEEGLNNGVPIWHSNVIVDFPLFEEFVQYAESCIVHSEYALNKIKTVFPKLTVHKIDQLYDLKPLRKISKPSECLRIGIFGGVDLQKQVDVVINVLAKIYRLDKKVNFRLDVVGAVHEACDSIYSLPKSLELEDKVFIHGRVDEDKYSELLSATDVIVALRVPTMGETSAVVMQGLQLGIPVIVNDVGWYAELPKIVDKISNLYLEQNLQNLLLKYLDEDYLQSKTTAISEYALEYFNFETYIENYQAILDYEYSNRLNKPLYQHLSKVFKDSHLIDDDLLLKGCLDKIKKVF